MLSQFLFWLKAFVGQEEEGQTLVEYALILVLIAIVVIVILTTVGGSVNTIFNDINDALQ